MDKQRAVSLRLRNDQNMINAQNVLQRAISEDLYLDIPPATPTHTSCFTGQIRIFIKSSHL